MARTRNEHAYESARERLLETGVDLIWAGSYAGTGINDVLKASGVPKGSFYHYFDSKESFGIAVAQHYNAAQLESARLLLQDEARPPIERLRTFFETARHSMHERDYARGCLMCNLSTELADEMPTFQAALQEHWRALVAEVALCLAEVDLAELRLQHLPPQEAADWLMNSWSGALTRMKATRSDQPLSLFMQATFNQKGTPL
jgi:TetR/AcrR family transcriptional repressor of nem operon